MFLVSSAVTKTIFLKQNYYSMRIQGSFKVLFFSIIFNPVVSVFGFNIMSNEEVIFEDIKHVCFIGFKSLS